MEKIETPLEVLSRAATMVLPCPAYPASDSDGFETPSTASSVESECDRTISPEAPQSKGVTGKWRRDRRARLPEYRENNKAMRSQSFNERRVGAAPYVNHSDGEHSEPDEVPANLSVNGKGDPPQYPGKNEAPIDMRLRSRPAPPPYRPSVITKNNETPPGSMSMCDPVIDEHFRRSLGDNYMNLFKKNNPQPASKPVTKDRASSPITFSNQTERVVAVEDDNASMSVDDHFAKALGDTWKQIQSKTTDDKPATKEIVDDHFSKALGETWKKIQSSKSDEKTDSKIISRSGVVI